MSPRRSKISPPSRSAVGRTSERRSTPRASAAIAENDADDSPQVGGNLKRLRSDRALSLEKLAKLTGVSRAMLGQIELGQSAPTIKTLWKISRALEVPFSALIGGKSSDGTTLLRAPQTRRFTNEDGTFVSRALFPVGGPRRVEFYELRLAAQAEERAVPHPAGTVETLAVNRGKIEIEVRGERYALAAGDVLAFEADAPHTYHNPSRQDAILYLVMTYAQSAL
jgi:transcriptional regulator with XRE-family HTH domain